MAKALELQLLDATGAVLVTFGVEGEWHPRLVFVRKAASEPPELQEIREAWEIRSCRVLSIDGSIPGLWSSLTGTLDACKTRGSAPIAAARLVLDPQGQKLEVLRLGPPMYERFALDEVEGLPDPEVPLASWLTLAALTVRISAVRRFADARGIVGWEQEVRTSWVNGLRVLEWRTKITTSEGTDAREKAKTFAVIPVSALGGDHTYDTSGPDGIDFVAIDSDELNPSRKPTVVEAVSRVRQWGVPTGVTAPGTGPTEVELTVTTKTTAAEESETTRAAARGPNALAWVLARAPDRFNEREVTHERATRTARGEWTLRRTRTKSDAGPLEDLGTRVEVEISGGARAIDTDPACGGYEPVLFIGAFGAWRATVTVTVEKRGQDLANKDLLLPPELEEPWLLDRNASTETDAAPAERGIQPGQDLYRRRARLAYVSTKRPRGSVLAALKKGRGAESYYLR